jgi:transposase-like protein
MSCILLSLENKLFFLLIFEEKFRNNQKRKVGSSWRMDETYIKIKGVWHYLYRAVIKMVIQLILCYQKIVMNLQQNPFLLKQLD